VSQAPENAASISSQDGAYDLSVLLKFATQVLRSLEAKLTTTTTHANRLSALIEPYTIPADMIDVARFAEYTTLIAHISAPETKADVLQILARQESDYHHPRRYRRDLQHSWRNAMLSVPLFREGARRAFLRSRKPENQSPSCDSDIFQLFLFWLVHDGKPIHKAFDETSDHNDRMIRL
jgi:hypothetical protein